MKFKDLKIRSKILMGFGVLLAISIFTSVFAMVQTESMMAALNRTIDHSYGRKEIIQNIGYAVMDLRRLTTAINAYAGDEARQLGFQAEAPQIMAKIDASIEDYAYLLDAEYYIVESDVAILRRMNNDLKNTINIYMRDLVLQL